MKIYTSYFGKGKTLRAQNIKMISIALYTPPNIKCPVMMSLAPTYSILHDKYKTNERYTHRYLSEVLNALDAKEVLEQIKNIAKSSDVALCCYEKPDEFCHRHIVAKWLTENTGINIQEFGKTNKQNVKQGELF